MNLSSTTFISFLLLAAGNDKVHSEDTDTYGSLSKQLKVHSDWLKTSSTMRTLIRDTALPRTERPTRALKAKKKVSKMPKSSKTSTLQTSLAQCEARLSVMEQPEFLFIQAVETCEVRRSIVGSTVSYSIASDVPNETVAFSDRPETLAYTSATTTFVEQFDEMFVDSLPNTGITLVSDNLGQWTGPLVAIFSEPRITDGMLVYDMSQSSSQDSVYSIASLFNGVTEDVVPFRDCAFFIDGFFGLSRCEVCTTIANVVAPIVFEAGGIATCIATCGVFVVTLGVSPAAIIAPLVGASCPLICSVALALGARATAKQICQRVPVAAC